MAVDLVDVATQAPRGGVVVDEACRTSVAHVWAIGEVAHILGQTWGLVGPANKMAEAVAEGARSAGATVDIRRVPETVPEDLARKSGYKMDQQAPVATVDELKDYDAIIVGAPTRFGRMPSQMAAFWDMAGGLWATGALNGKVGGAFTSTGSQHGGQETTIQSTHTVLLHLGLVIVGLPYSFKGQLRMDEITGGSPYGASTLADDGAGGDRQPSQNELDGARFQGRHVAEIARDRLRAGGAERIRWMIAPGDADPRDIGVPRHDHVEARIADQYGVFRIDAVAEADPLGRHLRIFAQEESA